MAGKSLAKISGSFIAERPFIRECLKKDLINFSQLARLIIEEKKLQKSSFEAVLVACRRNFEKLSLGKEYESRIIALLKKSKIEVKTKICVVVVSSKTPFSAIEKIVKQLSEKQEPFNIVQSSSGITFIVSEDFFSLIKESLKGFVVSEKTGLVEIILRSAKEIEQLPGTVAFIYSRLAEHGINIIETSSCWTDTLFAISEKDLVKAIEAMKF